MGPSDRRSTGFTDPQMAHLPLSHEVTHGADCVLDRNSRVDPMDVVEVDDFRLKASQALLAAGPDVLRPTIRAWHTGRDTEIAEFARDDVIVAAPLYRMGDQLLVFALAVSVRSVKKIDADLARPLEGFNRGRKSRALRTLFCCAYTSVYTLR